MRIPSSFVGRLVWLFLGYWALSVFTYAVTGRFEHFFFAINLSLAFVPLALAELLKKGDGKRWQWWATAVLIVLFFPNAFYLFTDFIHLGGTVFFTRTNPYAVADYVRDWIGWLRVVHIGLGAVLGGLAGVKAYATFKQTLDRNAPKLARFLPAMLLLSAVGIYIGRFLRFNSWDLFFRPWAVLVGIWNNLDNFAFLFILLYFLLQWTVIWILTPLFEHPWKEGSS